MKREGKFAVPQELKPASFYAFSGTAGSGALPETICEIAF